MPTYFAVVGGEGFLGNHIVTTLSSKYPSSKIYSLDIESRHPSLSNTSFHSIDLASQSSLSTFFSSLSLSPSDELCVFHTASPFLGAPKELCFKINVDGTKHLIEALKDVKSKKKLVYTSSGSVVWSDRFLKNVDERLPYPDGNSPAIGSVGGKNEVWGDIYNETKARAEMAVIEANGKDDLLTCAIRPAGIYGPKDRQVAKLMLDALKNGQGNIQIGDNNNLFDFTYVENLVHGHILAYERLDGSVDPEVFDQRRTFSDRTISRRKVLPTTASKPKDLPVEEGYRPAGMETNSPEMSEKEFEVVENSVSSLKASSTSPSDLDPPLPAQRNRFDQFYSYLASPPTSPIPVAGQVYFITDTEPIPFWDFSKVLFFHYNGFVAKKIWTIPKDLAWFMGFGGEWWTWVKGGGRAPLSRKTVVYMTSDRYFNTEKAKIFLGYEPIVGVEEGIKRTAKWFAEQDAVTPSPAGSKKSQ